MEMNNMVIMTFYHVSKCLPEDGEYVLAHLTKNNWWDSNDPFDKRYWKVVKFKKGISKEDRKKMERGIIEDPKIPSYISEHLIYTTRSSIYKSCDEEGNNLVPYNWEEFGPSAYFGQEVDTWARLPAYGELTNE